MSYSDILYGGKVWTVPADTTWHSQVWGSGDNSDAEGGTVNYPIPISYGGPKTRQELGDIAEINPEASDVVGLDNENGIIQRLEATSDNDIPANAMFSVGDGSTIYLQEDIEVDGVTVEANTPLPNNVAIPDYVKFTTSKTGYENKVLCTWHEFVNNKWWRIVGRIDVPAINTTEGTDAKGQAIGEAIYWFRNILGLIEITDPENIEADEQADKTYDETLWE